MSKDFVEDAAGNIVYFSKPRYDGNGDAELKFHKRYASMKQNPSLQIGVDGKCHDESVTVTAVFPSLAVFDAAVVMIFETMRKNVPVELTIYDEDDTAVYDGSHVMPSKWLASYDMKAGAQYKIEAKLTFVLAVAFHI